MELTLSASFFPLLENTKRYLVLVGGRGSGKCFGAGTRLVMHDGLLKAVEDIQSGDMLMGPDSKPRIVGRLVRGHGPLYRVHQNKGTDYVVNADHVLALKKSWTCERYVNETDFVAIPVHAYLGKSNRWRVHHFGYRVAIDWPAHPVLIDPYLLGVWLGDGRADGPAVTTADIEIKQYLEQYAKQNGYRLYDETKHEAAAHSYRISNGYIGRATPLMQTLHAYGLIDNKHIPYDYVANSREIRLALLAGLIDTDGHLAGNCYDLIQKNKTLARQIVFLCHSLGFRASIKPCIKTIRSLGFSGKYWRINISGNTQDIPCLISRKRVKEYHKPVDPQATGIAVTPDSNGPYYGFEVDGDKRFLLEDFTVVHNSEFAARKLIYRCLKESRHRFLVLRKIRAKTGESVVMVMKTLLADSGIKYEFNSTTGSMTFLGNEILFGGLDDPDKIKSIKGITGVWIEEATEFTERDFTDVDLCLREPGPAYHQIILSFNPDEARAPWLKERFFDRVEPDAFVHVSTVEDNPVRELRERYAAILDKLKAQDPALYKIYRLGQWAVAEGVIFSWDVPPFPVDVAFDEIFYGGDFGYSVDPAAVIRIYRKADEFWVQEVIYERGLTNQQLGARMKDAGITGEDVIYFDSAEPKSIQELCDMGFMVLPAAKGKDSVRAGIDFLKAKKIHIIDGSLNIVKERRTYVWRKDKDGRQLPEPVKFDDHAMAAIRYGIHTHCAMMSDDGEVMWL